MSRWLALGGMLALALPAQAQEISIPPPEYAFDRPKVLADQRIWGIAHGVRLLALACARAGFGTAAEAWVEWQERESAQIDVIRAALGQYYFKTDDAPSDAITAALGLSPVLELSPEELTPACETLAEALAQPRYDLAKRREELLKK